MSKAGDYIRAGASAAVAYYFSGGNPLAAYATFVSSLYGSYRQEQAQQSAREAYNAAQRARQTMIRSGVAPRQIVLGRARGSGPAVYMAAFGNYKQFLHMVIPLAGHPIDAIETVYLNDVALPDPDVNGFIQSGQFYKGTAPASNMYTTGYISPSGAAVVIALPVSPVLSIVSVTYSAYAVGSPLRTSTVVNSSNYSLSGQNLTINSGQPNGYYSVNYLVTQGGKAVVRVKKYLGTQTVADADLISESGGEWTSAHVGYGIPYLYIRLEYDEEVFGQIGRPIPSATMRGAIPYDVRKNLCPAYGFVGAVAGTPGTLPANMSVNPATTGLSSAVVGSGIDTKNNIPYLDLRIYGTCTNTASCAVVLYTVATAPAASSGQAWTCRAVLRWIAATGAVSANTKLALNSIDSGGSPTTEASSAALTATIGSDQVLSVYDAAFSGTAVKAGLRFNFGATAGVSYDHTIRIMQPELFQGAAGSAADPAIWTDNAALLTGWWLRQPIIGGRARYDQVLDSELIAEANICDEAIPITVGGTTQPRYTCNGTLDTAGAMRDNLEAILSGMAGNAAWIQGRWLIRSGSFETPTLTIDESCMAQGDITLAPDIPRRDLFNSASGTYIDASGGYVERQVGPITSSTYLAADGGVALEKTDLQFPMVKENIRAQRMAKIKLQMNRQAMMCELTCNLKAYDAVPGRTVYLTISNWGVTALPMLVTKRTYIAATRRIKLSLVAISSAIFAWDYGEIIPLQASPGSTLPLVGGRPAAPTVSAPSVYLASTATFGQFMAFANLTWTAASNVNVLAGGRVLIQFKRDNAATWSDGGVLPGTATTAVVGPMDAGAVSLIRVAFQDNKGRLSDWTIVVAAAFGLTGTGVPGTIIDVNCYKYTSGAGAHTCSVTFNTDGSISGDGLASGFFWFNPVGGSPGATLYIKTEIVGSLPGGSISAGTLGSVIALSSNRTWTFTGPTHTDYIAQLKHTVYADAGGTTVLGIGNSYLEADGA